LEIPPQLLVECDHTLEAGMKALCVLAALPDRPSAVLCSNDMTAIGVIRGAFDLGLNVPRDLSVVGFDDNQIAQFATPALTTVEMSYVEVANVAFRALLDAVEDQCNGSSREVCSIQSNLVLRCSTNLAPGRLGEGAAGKRADSGLPPKVHSESQSRSSSGFSTCASCPSIPVQIDCFISKEMP
jgi:DNA-binding LacI/PurR family transcriptional regulator